ncbi:hypothetical protein PG997_013700 [Apiospora hydei]|uniref:Rhodopsin domain-containing protein n=1 Tax=Apiospora hydei TaxID=1337664 RepID=A0ABR1V6Z8_9PEZI
MILSTAAIGLRFWAPRQQKAPLMIDDWTATVALISHIGTTIPSMGISHHSRTSLVFIELPVVYRKGLGYSSHDFTPEQQEARNKTDRVFQMVLNILTRSTLGFVKLSALVFYRRLFCTGSKTTILGVLTWITIVVVVLWLLAFELFAGFQCGTGFSELSEGSMPDICTLVLPSSLGLAISDFLLDFWILVLPIPGRLRAADLNQPIWTDRLTRLVFYGILECGMAIIAVNLPSLWVLVVPLNTTELVDYVKSVLRKLSCLRGDDGSGVGSDPVGTRHADDIKSIESFSTGPMVTVEEPRHDYLQVRLSFPEDPESRSWGVIKA